MKFAAVILFACIAVSSAAFTANLVQHTQPAVNKAMFSLRLAAHNKGVAIPAVQQILDQVVAQIQSTVTQLLAQAQAAVAHGQQVSVQLQNQLQNFVVQLQGLGGAAAQNVQAVIQNFLSGVSTILPGNNKGSLSDVIAQVQAGIAQAHALAQQLVGQAGDLPALLANALNSLLPADIAQVFIAQLGLSPAQRGGLGDLFNQLFGSLSNQFGQAAGAAGQAIANVVAQVTSVGQSAFAEVQAQASAFIQNVQNGASNLSAQAAAQALAHIGDLQEALGNQYQAVVDTLNGIVING